ncbi:hypothetical protein ILUMI_19128 [Ignelater luminosus]|uniref:Uncharacterized protein n=1 Tax=Ignelater luminosus TaxID=2038154 RepID=A0A8K0CGV5_IGNLU|nr:hypothetical protein ILUMI_19128 [Ignelater luminosus]
MREREQQQRKGCYSPIGRLFRWRIGECLPDWVVPGKLNTRGGPKLAYQIDTIEEGLPNNSLLNTLKQTSNYDLPGWKTVIERAKGVHSIKLPGIISMTRKQDDIIVTDMDFGHQDPTGEDIHIWTVGPPRSLACKNPTL